MDTYINLFLAAISLAGFIAVFLIFQYRKIDTYVDNRKPVLRMILRKEAEKNPDIHLSIQDIGKKSWDRSPLDRLNIPAVNRFIDDILTFRRKRTVFVRMGLISIISWASLAFIFIILFCLVQKEIISDYTGILWGSIGIFTASLIFTMVFIVVSIRGNWPE